MRILVTGAAGFIGSHYVRTLLTGGYPGMPDARVTVLDVFSYAADPANLDPVAGSGRLTVVRGDIRDRPLVTELMADADACVHFAAQTHVDRSIEDGGEFAGTNVVGTQTLLEVARRTGLGRFVHVSTDEVYGSIDTGSWAETAPLLPNSPYAASKAGADLLVRAAVRTHGLDACVTRGSNTYGPYQSADKLVPLFTTRLLAGLTVPLYGDGSHVRDWLHVDDHCRGVQAVLERGRAGEVYNIGGGTELANRDLTALLVAECGADPAQVVQVADRPGHDRRYSVATAKLRDELGVGPAVPFREGLAQTVRWYRERPGRWAVPAGSSVTDGAAAPRPAQRPGPNG